MRDGNSEPTPLSTGEYEQLRRATEAYREDLVLRLGAEIELTPAEMSQLESAHVAQRRHRGTEHYFVVVPTDSREVYLPNKVEHDARKYVTMTDINETRRVLPVTSRCLQMLVTSVGIRAAERIGRDGLADVSTRNPRRHFAQTALGDGIPPSVAMQIGGWDRIKSLAPSLSEPSEDEVLDTLSPAPANSDGCAVSGDPNRTRQVIEAVRSAGSALSAVNTRSEVEQAACGRLTDSDRYRFAWTESGETDARTSCTATDLDKTSLKTVRGSLAGRGTGFT